MRAKRGKQGGVDVKQKGVIVRGVVWWGESLEQEQARLRESLCVGR